jgi:hypothetical protein
MLTKKPRLSKLKDSGKNPSDPSGTKKLENIEFSATTKINIGILPIECLLLFDFHLAVCVDRQQDALRKQQCRHEKDQNQKSHVQMCNEYGKQGCCRGLQLRIGRAISAVEKCGLSLRKYPNLCGLMCVVLPAVKQNGLALEFASDEIKQNIEVVSAAVKQNKMTLEFASPDLPKSA